MDEQAIQYDVLTAFALGESAPDDSRLAEHLIGTLPAAADYVKRLSLAFAAMSHDDTVAPARAVRERANALFARPVASLVADWIEDLRQVAATLLFDSAAQPVQAGFRGAAEARQLAYTSDEADIDVQVTRTGGPDALWTVRGRARARGEAGAPSRVALIRSMGETIAEADVEPTGRFRLNVEPGTFELWVQVGDAAVCVAPLRIG